MKTTKLTHTQLRHHINQRVKEIQIKHNFMPSKRIDQVRDYPDLRQIFVEFRELLKLAEKFGLTVDVPFDPSGLEPMKHVHKFTTFKAFRRS